MRELCERVGGVVNAILTPPGKVPRTPPLFDNHDGLHQGSPHMEADAAASRPQNNTATPRSYPSLYMDSYLSAPPPGDPQPGPVSLNQCSAVYLKVPALGSLPANEALFRSDWHAAIPRGCVLCPILTDATRTRTPEGQGPEASRYPRSARCDLPAGPGDRRIGSAACRHGYFRSRVILTALPAQPRSRPIRLVKPSLPVPPSLHELVVPTLPLFSTARITYVECYLPGE
ncbi:hypothetical protein CPLU01_04087 [Colletotrichum plurivorum]|uniref:Uncharacterized protein n=1 Tax=Colletotrichum plurivorum TaxID=2175906 RepID=A0A8H6KQS8_9PEZI|nr:hypothetical protein CPLU01_04087 [Colletotrichum plurivorum]